MKIVKRIIFAILIIFLFFSLTKNIFDYKKTLNFYQSFKNDYEKEKKRQISLQTQALKNSDKNAIEKTIRDKLNLLKPDEIEVIIPIPTPTPIIITPPPAPVYKQWLQVFFQN